MSKFPEFALAAFAALMITSPAAAQDAAAGERVFKRCQACHAVGDGAENKIGPHLNDVIGRTAGSLEGFKYSGAMVQAGENGLVWNDETLHQYLADPRGMVKGTRMAFAGLKKQEDLDDVIAYLKTFSGDAGEPDQAMGEEAPADDTADAAPAPDSEPASEEARVAAADVDLPEHGVFHLGRKASEDEITAWDIDIAPDGDGLPKGSGTVAEGEPLYSDLCSSCHGVFGEGAGRWPVLAGGQDSLTDMRPVKTIGSYWPYLSTVYDYVRRAMPFGNARSLTDDEVYALTAYLLYLNDVVTDEEFELSSDNFTQIELPNVGNFIEDNRTSEAHYADKAEACMTDCKGGDVEITMRAQVLDVTPDSDEEGGGGID